eukprot:gene376-6790_t
MLKDTNNVTLINNKNFLSLNFLLEILQPKVKNGKEIDSIKKIQEIIESITTDIKSETFFTDSKKETKERRRCIKCQVFMEKNRPKHLAKCDKCHAKIKKVEQKQRERAGKQEEKVKRRNVGHSKPKCKDASKAQIPAGKKTQESFQAQFSNFRQMLSQMDTAPNGEDSDFNFIKRLMFRMATTQDTVMDIINQHSYRSTGHAFTANIRTKNISQYQLKKSQETF